MRELGKKTKEIFSGFKFLTPFPFTAASIAEAKGGSDAVAVLQEQPVNILSQYEEDEDIIFK